MPAQLRDQGRYELFETNHGHRILVLNNDRWFAWVDGKRGEILVRSGSDHKKDHVLQKGEFYLVDFEGDPNYKDMPHLFLQQEDRFQELMVPNGLPTEVDHQKKIVRTDEKLPRKKLKQYLEPHASSGAEERTSRSGGGSTASTRSA